MDVGLIFAVIVSILLMGLLIVFGYNQLVNMQNIQEQAEILKTLERFGEIVDIVYNEGGESVKVFDLTFPRTAVSKVCFPPLYQNERLSIRKSKLRSDLTNIIDIGTYEKYQLIGVLISQRFTDNPGGVGEIDNGESVMIFFHNTAAPKYEYIEHLAPSRKTDPGGSVLCVGPTSSVVLRRKFDNNGAWVDIELKTS